MCDNRRGHRIDTPAPQPFRHVSTIDLNTPIGWPQLMLVRRYTCGVIRYPPSDAGRASGQSCYKNNATPFLLRPAYRDILACVFTYQPAYIIERLKMSVPEKILIVGAGPVGSLAALYAATRGYDVEIYELRNGQLSPFYTFALGGRS